MRCVVFGTRSFDESSLREANTSARHELTFIQENLSERTAGLSAGHEAACLVVGDSGSAPVLETLKAQRIRGLVLRSAGFNHVDLEAAARLGLPVLRVPAYSPYSVAEHAVAHLLTLNRRVHRAYNRVREFNFAIEGLMGQDLHGQTVGVVGLGHIGLAFARIMLGFGCRVLGYDPAPSDEARALPITFVDKETLFRESFVVSLHCPLLPSTHHFVGQAELDLMPAGSFLINTSRGAVIDHRALIKCLKTGRLGGVGLDVYEEEEGVFFRDLSDKVLTDDQLVRLMSFPQVLITGHQGFFTRQAVTAIAETTIRNLDGLASGQWDPANEVHPAAHLA